MSEKKDVDVVCLGILVADVFCQPLANIPEPGKVEPTDKIELLAGGCATNTAIDLAKIGIETGIIGKVGEDILGGFMIDELRRNGVDISQVKYSRSIPTSTTMVILSVSEDRRYIHCTGANVDLQQSDIVINYISKAKVLYVGGYLVLPRLDGKPMASILQAARKQGVVTLVDVAVVGSDGLGEKCRAILPHVDVFLPNSDEAYEITGKQEPGEQADTLLAWGAGMVVITMGEKGAFLKTKKGDTIRASIYDIEGIDPSGAGDAFDAGFIVGILNNWDQVETLKFASAVAASCVREVGANKGIFTMEEALDFMKHNEIKIVTRE